MNLKKKNYIFIVLNFGIATYDYIDIYSLFWFGLKNKDLLYSLTSSGKICYSQQSLKRFLRTGAGYM